MSHGKLVAAKTITILRVPSSLVELLFTPSTWTRSSDFTLLDDSCSPDALKKRSYCELGFNIGTKHIWQIIFTINHILVQNEHIHESGSRFNMYTENKAIRRREGGKREWTSSKHHTCFFLYSTCRVENVRVYMPQEHKT